MAGWPESKSEVPEILQAYFSFRDELTLQNQLVFKGRRLVIPAVLRKRCWHLHMLHIMAQRVVSEEHGRFWPRMTVELQEYTAKCDVCMKYRDTPSKEPLQSHDVEARPWAKVGADMCARYWIPDILVTDNGPQFDTAEFDNFAKTWGFEHTPSSPRYP